MDLPSWSPLLAMDGPAAECSVCPVLRLNELNISRKLLANLENARRDREIRVEVANADSVPKIMDALICLHEARWRQKHQAGVLHSEEVRRFHRSAAPALLRAGLLRLYGLCYQGQWAAVHYCLSAHGRTYYYLAGFDPSIASHSPGNLLIHHSITEAMESGDREYDFLRGQEQSKYRWGAKNTRTFRVRRTKNE
jgi:CelD/BcsL family acetyltransferase involved in cellulose biosynthesis